MNQLELDLQPIQEYRTIPLTQGQFAIVDPEDYEWLMRWKWCAIWSDRAKSFYAVRATSRRDGKQRLIRMHREVSGVPVGVEVDHKDRQTLNNRRVNLRPASHTQNRWNIEKQANNTSGFKGATWCKTKKRWRAVITVNGKKKALGQFSTPEEAGKAYETASAQMHGEFSSVFFKPEQVESGQFLRVLAN